MPYIYQAIKNNQMNELEKEFIPYGQALALKELEFDEPCFAWYVSENHGLEYGKVIQSDLLGDAVIAPTFSQAFRWFRENYGLEGVAQRSEDFIWYKWKISQYNEDGKKYVADWYEYKTYEEAELACLRKLIEIVKGGEE